MRPRSILFVLAGLMVALLSPAVVAAGSQSGAVFTLSNSTSGNRVLVWHRAADGSLSPAGSVATGGTGTGAGLGSQGALTLSPNHRWLYAVNPGSDEVSVFRVQGTHLRLVEVAPSGGHMPISVTARGRLVYVLYGGGDGNIQGFARSTDGILDPIVGSSQPLSQAAPGPAQIGFSPNGDNLVVTEKGTNRITFYDVDDNGAAGAPEWRSSAGATPFGFEFTGNGTLLVSEAFGGAPDASATSSYRFRPNGNLRVLDGPVFTTETAACWVAITNNGNYAYVTNTGSGSVSGYSVADNGDLTLLDADGVTASTGVGSSPIDAAFDATSEHLYTLLAGSDKIAILDRMADGSLDNMGSVTVADGAVGLAAY
ncbi:MAG: beta-propeller fold lactonase family protein [Candidatus Limnocylindrales bacterium]